MQTRLPGCSNRTRIPVEVIVLLTNHCFWRNLFHYHFMCFLPPKQNMNNFVLLIPFSLHKHTHTHLSARRRHSARSLCLPSALARVALALAIHCKGNPSSCTRKSSLSVSRLATFLSNRDSTASLRLVGSSRWHRTKTAQCQRPSLSA